LLFVHRDAAPVVGDCDVLRFVDPYIDAVACAVHRLVDRVVQDLTDEVMQTADVRRADVHAGTATHGLEALEDLDVLRAIRPRRLAAVARGLISAARPYVLIALSDGHVLSLCPAGADQELVQTLEVLVGVVIDGNTPALAPTQDLHFGAQRGTQLARHLREVRIAAAQARTRSTPSRRVDHPSSGRLPIAAGQ